MQGLRTGHNQARCIARDAGPTTLVAMHKGGLHIGARRPLALSGQRFDGVFLTADRTAGGAALLAAITNTPIRR